jgi:hypothetical protein
VNSKSVVAAIVLLALGFTTAAQSAAWVQTWGAAPLPSSAAMGPFPATPSFNHQTIRQTLRLSVGGSRIRVRLSNEYGSKPLSLGAVRVALADEHGNARPGSERQALFAGRPEARVPPGAPLLSDPIDLPVGALATLIILRTPARAPATPLACRARSCLMPATTPTRLSNQQAPQKCVPLSPASRLRSRAMRALWLCSAIQSPTGSVRRRAPTAAGLICSQSG